MNSQTLQRFKKRIEQHGAYLQIEQLCLDGLEIVELTPQAKQQLEKCINIQYLTLNHCEIASLQNFPYLPYLEALQIIGNQISGKDMKHLLNCPNLQHLALDQNNIQGVEDFDQLNQLEFIEHLQIVGNPVCHIDGYRGQIFERVNKLKIIDSQDEFGDEDVMFGTDTESQNSDKLTDSQDQEGPQGQQEQQQYNYSGHQGHKKRNY